MLWGETLYTHQQIQQCNTWADKTHHDRQEEATFESPSYRDMMIFQTTLVNEINTSTCQASTTSGREDEVNTALLFPLVRNVSCPLIDSKLNVSASRNYGTLKLGSSINQLMDSSPHSHHQWHAFMFSFLHKRLFFDDNMMYSLLEDQKRRKIECTDHYHGGKNEARRRTSWKIATVVALAIAIIAALRIKTVYEHYEHRVPEWTWDRNVYLPSGVPGLFEERQQKMALIAQMTEDLAMRQFSDISTRPNRAYARQWQMDHVNYYAGRVSYSSKSCYDKVFVLQTLAGTKREPLWPHSPQAQYDVILLLPSDAIIIDMDENIVNTLLPKDKLVAIAGWNNTETRFSSNSGVVLFNLRHKHAMNVIDRWWTISQESYKTCGADNGIAALVDAISVTMDQQAGETLEDLIEPISEYPNGSLGKRQFIKCLPSYVPGARSELFWSNLLQSGEAIHQTADAVCYRYYPKCEVVI